MSNPRNARLWKNLEINIKSLDDVWVIRSLNSKKVFPNSENHLANSCSLGTKLHNHLELTGIKEIPDTVPGNSPGLIKMFSTSKETSVYASFLLS